MFDLDKQIADWRVDMSRAGIRSAEVLDELEAHLREQMERLSPEERNEAAFQAAVKQLGDSQKLKREFAKVNRFRFWLPRENPAELNFLGVCFMLFGLNIIASILRMMTLFWAVPLSTRDSVIFGSWALLCGGVQLVVGIGLLSRKSFWRYCAFVMAAFQGLSSLYEFWSRVFGPEKNYTNGSYFPCMGVFVPMRFHWIPELLTVGILIWGCWYLSQPSVRKLFRTSSKTQTA